MTFLFLFLRLCIASFACCRVVTCDCIRAAEAAMICAPFASCLRASTIGVGELLWCLSSLFLISVACFSTSWVLLSVFVHHDSCDKGRLGDLGTGSKWNNTASGSNGCKPEPLNPASTLAWLKEVRKACLKAVIKSTFIIWKIWFLIKSWFCFEKAVFKGLK